MRPENYKENFKPLKPRRIARLRRIIRRGNQLRQMMEAIKRDLTTENIDYFPEVYIEKGMEAGSDLNDDVRRNIEMMDFTLNGAVGRATRRLEAQNLPLEVERPQREVKPDPALTTALHGLLSETYGVPSDDDTTDATDPDAPIPSAYAKLYNAPDFAKMGNL